MLVSSHRIPIAIIEFIEHQRDILRPLTGAPLGTDMMPTNGVNWRQMHRKLDLVEFNHYDGEGGLGKAVFWMDFARPMKPRPFWNTETHTCWNGSTTANGYKEPGFCRANSWLPVALGSRVPAGEA